MKTHCNRLVLVLLCAVSLALAACQSHEHPGDSADGSSSDEHPGDAGSGSGEESSGSDSSEHPGN